MTDQTEYAARSIDASRGPIQLQPAHFQRDLDGRAIAIFAGHAPIAEGQFVLVIDDAFRSHCAIEGGAMAEEALTAARQRFVESGGRRRFDELAAQLEQAYIDADTAEMLAEGYSDEARSCEASGAATAEVLRWQDYATDEKRKAEQLEKEIPILRRQVEQERDLIRSLLSAELRDALIQFQNEHFARSAKLEREALAVFLPKYAEALRQRFVARAAGPDMLSRFLEREDLHPPKRPNAEQPPPPPPIPPNFAALAASVK